MKDVCRLYHRIMTNKLKACKTANACTLVKLENCYQVCFYTWVTISEIASKHTFDSLDTEIEFFKVLKPSFTSEIEYYSLLYNSALFKPDFSNDIISFWKRESSRLERFISKNKAFYDYYKNCETDMDEIYFTKLDEEAIDFTQCSLYDYYGNAISAKDNLVAGILSHKRFCAYTLKQLSFITAKKNSL